MSVAFSYAAYNYYYVQAAKQAAFTTWTVVSDIVSKFSIITVYHILFINSIRNLITIIIIKARLYGDVYIKKKIRIVNSLPVIK